MGLSRLLLLLLACLLLQRVAELRVHHGELGAWDLSWIELLHESRLVMGRRRRCTRLVLCTRLGQIVELLVRIAWLTGEPWGCDDPTSALKHVVSVLLLLCLLLLSIRVLATKWLLFDLLLLHIAHVTLVYLRLTLTHGLGCSEGHTRA